MSDSSLCIVSTEDVELGGTDLITLPPLQKAAKIPNPVLVERFAEICAAISGHLSRYSALWQTTLPQSSADEVCQLSSTDASKICCRCLLHQSCPRSSSCLSWAGWQVTQWGPTSLPASRAAVSIAFGSTKALPRPVEKLAAWDWNSGGHNTRRS